MTCITTTKMTMNQHHHGWKIQYGDAKFEFQPSSYVVLEDGRQLPFDHFKDISTHDYHSGTFNGVYLEYKHLEDLQLQLRCFYLLDITTHELLVRLVVLQDDCRVKEIIFPDKITSSFTHIVLPVRQGLCLPIEKHIPVELPFNGQFASAGAYLPLLGLYGNRELVAIINETYEDSRYIYHHEDGSVQIVQMRSLGKFENRRDLRFCFRESGNYNEIAKIYLGWAKENGLYTSLREKAIRLPQIHQLASCAFVHMGIQTYVQPESRFFDPSAPDKNNHLTSFQTRLQEMHDYKALLPDTSLYLHLDGWGIAYDNGHPDVMPINQNAGGATMMKALVDGIHQDGNLFGIHDQYRDYYYKATSYNEDYAIMSQDGSHYHHASWAGGHQNYLCSSFARDYVKRNFTMLENEGIHLDGAYLDVFTCNEPDECFHQDHPTTRKQCLVNRGLCFDYLISKGIMPSSEEVNSWAINQLVFCHYAPFECQMHEDRRLKEYCIPLFNLVYHDCVIIPWMMDIPKEDDMLYCLLNGGNPYLRRDPAYANIDGSFNQGVLSVQAQKERVRIATTLAKDVFSEAMMHHEFLDESHLRQKSTFSNGISVIINLEDNTYQISREEGA